MVTAIFCLRRLSHFASLNAADTACQMTFAPFSPSYFVAAPLFIFSACNWRLTLNFNFVIGPSLNLNDCYCVNLPLQAMKSRANLFFRCNFVSVLQLSRMLSHALNS